MIRSIFIALLLSGTAVAQPDTVTVMTYNLMSYNGGTSQIPHFRTVLDSIRPDILVCQEIEPLSSVDTFLDSVLNYAISEYAAGTFIDGPDDDNALFYKTATFDFISNAAIPTDDRDLNQFSLRHKITGDTLYLYALHLNSGGNSADQQARLQQIDSLRQVTAQLSSWHHFIVAGDFNMSTSEEPGFQAMLDQATPGYAIDPLNVIGTWEDDSTYAEYHTQSTRTRAFGGGSSAGLTNRLDMLLLSQTITDSSRINFLENSYITLGNDGNHYADSINALPNTAVSNSMANALHYASDHLPVCIDIAFTNEQAPFTLTTAVSGNGNISLSSGSGTYAQATTITVTAIPDPGYIFSGWTGELTGSNNPATIRVDRDKSITAVFTQPLAGPITLEEVVTGTASDTGSITTATNLTAANSQLYLAAISTRSNVAVSTISGLGLKWTEVDAQCGARNQINNEVWMAMGAPSGNDSVRVNFADKVTNAVIAVSRYSGIDIDAPIGTIISHNTLGANGTCAGGTDGNSYTFDFNTTRDSSIVFASIGLRHRTHTAGAGYTEQQEISIGTSGDKAGLAIMDRLVPRDSTIALNGSFNNPVDWSVIGVEILSGDTLFDLDTTIIGTGSLSLTPDTTTHSRNAIVSLTATAGAGYYFGGWSGDLDGSMNPANLTMDNNKSIAANFFPLTPLQVNTKVFLEGPFGADSMRTTLRAMDSIPAAQPFNASPWNYNGTETATTPPDSIGDWVLLKLRSSVSGNDLAARAAFITSHGYIVDTTGNTPVNFDSLTYGNYFVLIYHRNHLAIMSAAAIALDSASTVYDFSSAQSQAYGTTPMVEVSSGIFALKAGDANSDGNVDSTDQQQVWRLENGTKWEYSAFGDFNLDGSVDVVDFNLYWRGNNGDSTNVPVSVEMPIIGGDPKINAENTQKVAPGNLLKTPRQNKSEQ